MTNGRFDGSSEKIVSAGASVRIWEAKSGRLLQTIAATAPLAVDWLQDLVAARSADDRVTIWRMDSYEPVAAIETVLRDEELQVRLVHLGAGSVYAAEKNVFALERFAA